MTKDEIRNLHLFSSLEEKQLDQVCETASVVKLDTHQNLFFQGETATHFYLLLSGQVKLYLLSPEGEEKIIDIIQPQQFFAEAVMFMDGQRYPVNATALVESEVLAFENRRYRSIIEETPEVALAVLSDLSRRMHFMLNEIDRLALHTATYRFVYYLLNIAGAMEDQIDLAISKQTIASQLSIKPETLSRILRQLKSEGVVEADGRQIKILDREALQELLLK